MNQDELLSIARSRLYPSLTNPNYLVLRSRRLIFEQWVQRLKGNLAVLDIGGRYQPYRPLLQGKIEKYVALDVLKTDFVDVVGSGEELPFQEESFDLVIATGVFEYFYKPHEAAQNIYRVLRPGGTLLVSLGAVVPRFVDEECWRYLPRGLRSVFSPFSQVTIAPEVSSVGGFCRFVNLGLHDFLQLRSLKFVYERTVCPALNLVGLCLETAQLTTNDQWTGNYSVMAIK
jgi:SAM-dependent methyltransferase